MFLVRRTADRADPRDGTSGRGAFEPAKSPAAAVAPRACAVRLCGMRRSAALAFATSLLVASSASSARALELGEKAPELEVTAWAKGDPITIAGGAQKNVFVVEFFSAFKSECVDALAAATKLQDKWKTKGLEIVAVTVESKAEIDKFLAEHPTSCRVAIDEFHNTQSAYVGADPALPRAVVVDRSGSIVFLGDPTDGMDRVVDDVVAGKFDLAKAVEIRKLKEEMWKDGGDDGEEDAPPVEAKVDAKEAAKKRAERIDALCDKILDLDPADVSAWNRRADGFRRRDDLEGYRKFVKTWVERMKDDAKALARVARQSMDEWKVTWRDPDLATTTARRAVEISKSQDAEVLDAYAQVLAALGLLDMAVEQEKKAVALEPKDDDYARSLAFFQSCLATKQKAKPPKK
jgi:tetratricopeptide (TPR) repeat protein